MTSPEELFRNAMDSEDELRYQNAQAPYSAPAALLYVASLLRWAVNRRLLESLLVREGWRLEELEETIV